jgi:hypothetical protein
MEAKIEDGVADTAVSAALNSAQSQLNQMIQYLGRDESWVNEALSWQLQWRGSIASVAAKWPTHPKLVAFYNKVETDLKEVKADMRDKFAGENLFVSCRLTPLLP